MRVIHYNYCNIISLFCCCCITTLASDKNTVIYFANYTTTTILTEVEADGGRVVAGSFGAGCRRSGALQPDA